MRSLAFLNQKVSIAFANELFRVSKLSLPNLKINYSYMNQIVKAISKY